MIRDVLKECNWAGTTEISTKTNIGFVITRDILKLLLLKKFISQARTRDMGDGGIGVLGTRYARTDSGDLILRELDHLCGELKVE
jgi:predicted transcriptional regulator